MRAQRIGPVAQVAFGVTDRKHLAVRAKVNHRVGYSIGRWEGETLVIETRLITEWHAPRWPHSDQMRIVERWSLRDPRDFDIVGLRRDRPPPEIDGPLLVNEMTMSDPVFYVNDAEVVTVLYRRQESGAMFEDNCSEGIWLEALERTAAPEE